MINVLGVYPVEGFDWLDSLLVSILAIVIVFAILAFIILVTWLIQKGMEKVEYVTQINPKPENEILSTDEEAVVAALVATIDYHREFNADAKLVSIELVEED